MDPGAVSNVAASLAVRSSRSGCHGVGVGTGDAGVVSRSVAGAVGDRVRA